MTTDHVIEASDETFQADVLDASQQRPVVVDFWAPWCGPCRVLGPTLEALADEFGDAVQLVKINVDENPRVATTFQVQGIPAVKAFRDGRVVAEFVGALPEPQVRSFFDSLVPSEADEAVTTAAAARAAGDLATARAELEVALKLDPRHQAASIALAELLLDGGQLDRAEELAARFPADPLATGVLGRVAMAKAAAGEDRAALDARLAANPDDAAAHYALGNVLAAAGEWEDALEHLLATVRLDRKLDDDGARKRMLDVFNLLGDEHELTREYRRRLTNALF